jgi:hypothetical protein
MNKTEFEKIQSNINQFQTNEPSYHSSQIKRPIIHFGINDQNILDINKIPNVNQSFSINEINFSQNSKNNNTNTNINNNINPFKNNDNSGSNLAFYNKSIQQEKYDSIKVFCSKKNDQDNYPLISYENFLLIDSLCEKNSSSNESYQNFLLNKNASIELYSKFCTLLMNRYIISKQNSSINKYPKVVYQIIFDINNVYNYLSKDIVEDAKESNLFMVLVNYQNIFDVAVFNKSNNTGIYFLINRNIKRSIILGLMETINKVVYPEQKFEINISDYSGFSTGNKIVLPFIILDFYSRYKNNLPIDDEDYYYQTILILSEIMTNNLITK